MIYRTGSLTRAASALHMTQPEVSRYLSHLRDHFKDPLFVRDGQVMAPTAKAGAMISDIRTSLNILFGTSREPDAFDPGTCRKQFIIAMRDSFEYFLLNFIARKVHAEAPGLSFQSIPIERGKIRKQLMGGELDFAVDIPLIVNSSIGQHKLFELDACLAMRRGHPLFDEPLTMETWLSAEHVTVSGRLNDTAAEDHYLQSLGIKRNVAVQCQNHYSACDLVSNSDMVMVVSRLFGHGVKDRFHLCLAELPMSLPLHELYLYWPKACDQTPSHLWLQEFILRHSRIYADEVMTITAPKITPAPVSGVHEFFDCQ